MLLAALLYMSLHYRSQPTCTPTQLMPVGYPKHLVTSAAALVLPIVQQQAATDIQRFNGRTIAQTIELHSCAWAAGAAVLLLSLCSRLQRHLVCKDDAKMMLKGCFMRVNCTPAQLCSIDFLDLTLSPAQAKIVFPDIITPLVRASTCHNHYYQRLLAGYLIIITNSKTVGQSQ
jgi:hypothetical protein